MLSSADPTTMRLTFRRSSYSLYVYPCKKACADSPIGAATAKCAAERCWSDQGKTTCRHVQPCRDHVPDTPAEKLGTAFAMVRADVSGNITRLRDRQADAPGKYADLFPIALDEVASGKSGGSRSATKGILWLKRCVGDASVSGREDRHGRQLPCSITLGHAAQLALAAGSTRPLTAGRLSVRYARDRAALHGTCRTASSKMKSWVNMHT